MPKETKDVLAWPVSATVQLKQLQAASFRSLFAGVESDPTKDLDDVDEPTLVDLYIKKTKDAVSQLDCF